MRKPLYSIRYSDEVSELTFQAQGRVGRSAPTRPARRRSKMMRRSEWMACGVEQPRFAAAVELELELELEQPRYHRTEFLLGMSQLGAIVFAVVIEVDRI
jgi:hypothetical protein